MDEGYLNINIQLIVSAAGVIIQLIIASIGFFITTRNIKKQHEYDLLKYRKNEANKQLEKIPETITDIVQNLFIFKENNPDVMFSYIDKLEPIATKIIAYGSLESNKIYARIRSDQDIGDSQDYFYKNLSCCILLYCQIRYDLSGEKFNPILSCALNLREVGFDIEAYKEINNKIVKELKLDDYLLIK